MSMFVNISENDDDMKCAKEQIHRMLVLDRKGVIVYMTVLSGYSIV